MISNKSIEGGSPKLDEIQVQEKPHLKFLKKQTAFQLEVGDYIPNVLIDESNGAFLYDYIKHDHLIVAFLSTECSTCEQAMEVMKSYAGKYPNLNMIAIVHTSLEIYELLKEYLGDSVPLYYMSKSKINEELKIYSYPTGITLNKHGQVLQSEPCGAEFIFDLLKTPLRKILF
jgi:thiol-disulfide isomerase/thioredoxin